MHNEHKLSTVGLYYVQFIENFVYFFILIQTNQSSENHRCIYRIKHIFRNKPVEDLTFYCHFYFLFFQDTLCMKHHFCKSLLNNLSADLLLYILTFIPNPLTLQSPHNTLKCRKTQLQTYTQTRTHSLGVCMNVFMAMYMFAIVFFCI